jgi:hypothetical protein
VGDGVRRSPLHSFEKDWLRAMRLTDRRKIVVVGLVACAIAIAGGAWRHRNAPNVDVGFMFPEPPEHAEKRLADERARQDAWLARTRASIKRDHEVSLRDLTNAERVGDGARCDAGRRSELRSSISAYAMRRTGAYRNAPNEGLVNEVAQTWDTLADREAIAIAVDLMNRGYVLLSDFQSWTAEYSTIFPVRQDSLPACAGRLD